MPDAASTLFTATPGFPGPLPALDDVLREIQPLFTPAIFLAGAPGMLTYQLRKDRSGDAFDVVTVHQVLHYLDDPGRALREAGVTPIAGLVHHGSGPRDTSLLDPAFPERPYRDRDE